MSDANVTQSNRLVLFLGLAMALGPLTALSLGNKYADEETRERANAGLENAEPVDVLARYGKPNGVPSYASDKHVLDLVTGSGLFDDFETMLTATGIADQLTGGDYTLFVPSDEAFSRMSPEQRAALLNDKDAMSRIVSKHIIPGRYTATDLMQMQQARTLDGEMIPVGTSSEAGGHIGVGGAGVVKTNLFAADGVVHVIDRPIM
ncbi:MAG: fasciclin domain-containing protein [Thiohalocapsa sp.]|nr:fasciclin domain-containing protein [Thiohalocapsa sp.]MCF7990844.1 fasciclin domain-containing protein [Thiohalocapsa sp.]